MGRDMCLGVNRGRALAPLPSRKPAKPAAEPPRAAVSEKLAAAPAGRTSKLAAVLATMAVLGTAAGSVGCSKPKEDVSLTRKSFPIPRHVLSAALTAAKENPENFDTANPLPEEAIAYLAEYMINQEKDSLPPAQKNNAIRIMKEELTARIGETPLKDFFSRSEYISRGAHAISPWGNSLPEEIVLFTALNRTPSAILTLNSVQNAQPEAPATCASPNPNKKYTQKDLDQAVRTAKKQEADKAAGEIQQAQDAAAAAAKKLADCQQSNERVKEAPAEKPTPACRDVVAKMGNSTRPVTHQEAQVLINIGFCTAPMPDKPKRAAVPPLRRARPAPSDSTPGKDI